MVGSAKASFTMLRSLVVRIWFPLVKLSVWAHQRRDPWGKFEACWVGKALEAGDVEGREKQGSLLRKVPEERHILGGRHALRHMLDCQVSDPIRGDCSSWVDVRNLTCGEG